MPRVPKATASRPSPIRGIKGEDDLQLDISQTQTQTRRSSRTANVKPEGRESLRPQCLQCGKTFSRQPDLVRHQKLHDPTAHRIRCPYSKCSYSTFQKSNMDNHVRSIHTGETIPCKDCGIYKHTDRAMISRHRKNRCPGVKKEDYGPALMPPAGDTTATSTKGYPRKIRVAPTVAFDLAASLAVNTPTTPLRRSTRLKPKTEPLSAQSLPVTPARRSGSRRSPSSSAKADLLFTKPATSPLSRSLKKNAPAPHQGSLSHVAPSTVTAAYTAEERADLTPTASRTAPVGPSSAEYDPFFISAELEAVIKARIDERGYNFHSDPEASGPQRLFLTLPDNTRSGLLQANSYSNGVGPKYMTDLEVGVNTENLRYYHDDDKALMMPVLHDGVGPLPASSYN